MHHPVGDSKHILHSLIRVKAHSFRACLNQRSLPSLAWAQFWFFRMSNEAELWVWETKNGQQEFYCTASSLKSAIALTAFGSLLLRFKKIFFSFSQSLNTYGPSTYSGVDTKGFAFLSVTALGGRGRCLGSLSSLSMGQRWLAVPGSNPSPYCIWGRFSGWAFFPLWKKFGKARGHHFGQRFLWECSSHHAFHLPPRVTCTFLRKQHTYLNARFFVFLNPPKSQISQLMDFSFMYWWIPLFI